MTCCALALTLIFVLGIACLVIAAHAAAVQRGRAKGGEGT